MLWNQNYRRDWFLWESYEIWFLKFTENFGIVFFFFLNALENSYNINPIEIMWRKMVRSICLKPVAMASLHTLKWRFTIPAHCTGASVGDYPAGAAAGSYIASVSSSYPAGAAAGSYIASVSSSDFFFRFLLSVNIAISPTAYMVWPCNSGIFISLMTATKRMGLEMHLGSFGVTGVKKVNHVKNMKTGLI